MAYYSVLAVTPTSDDWGEAYIAAVTPVLAKHGGKYLARTGSHEQLEGEDNPATLRILVEWPNRDAAIAFMHDPDYLPHLKARTAGSESEHFLIAGKDDLA